MRALYDSDYDVDDVGTFLGLLATLAILQRVLFVVVVCTKAVSVSSTAHTSRVLFASRTLFFATQNPTNIRLPIFFGGSLIEFKQIHVTLCRFK